MSWLDKEQFEMRMRCYEEGLTSTEAAALCGCTKEAYMKWCRKNGVYGIRKNGYSTKIVDSVRQLASEYMTDTEISEILGIDCKVLQNIRKVNGIPSASRIPVNVLQEIRRELSESKEKSTESEYSRGVYDGMLKVAELLCTVQTPRKYIPASQRKRE